MDHAFAFMDGGYLRAQAEADGIPPWIDPCHLAKLIYAGVRGGLPHESTKRSVPRRVNCYDALDEADPPQNLARYLSRIDELPQCQVRTGRVRPGRHRQQKRVDVQLTVDMLTGAFSGLYDVAMLFTGDDDFVPLVDEVRRLGALVIVVGAGSTTSDSLRLASDQFLALEDSGFWNGSLYQLIVPEGV